MVGDRLDTDIALARAMGCSSLLVFTGVATADDLLTELSPGRARQDERAPLPTHAVSHVSATCSSWLSIEQTILPYTCT